MWQKAWCHTQSIVLICTSALDKILFLPGWPHWSKLQSSTSAHVGNFPTDSHTTVSWNSSNFNQQSELHSHWLAGPERANPSGLRGRFKKRFEGKNVSGILFSPIILMEWRLSNALSKIKKIGFQPRYNLFSLVNPIKDSLSMDEILFLSKCRIWDLERLLKTPGGRYMMLLSCR